MVDRNRIESDNMKYQKLNLYGIFNELFLVYIVGGLFTA